MRPAAPRSRIAPRASGMTALGYGAAEAARALGVSRETAERLETHRALLAEWNERMNLVGPRELEPERYWRRHVLDCGQLALLAPDARRWVDLGAGAGFPGIVIACMLAGEPGAAVHLVESTAKKARFLEEAVRVLGLPAKVFNARIEAFGAGEGCYDVVTARALAPLNRLIAYAKPILDRGAQGLFLKGADLDAELAAADLALGGAFQRDVLMSLSDPRGRVLRIAGGASVR
jgi:16S rRNA (guanine527-N7)-methyltransferase